MIPSLYREPFSLFFLDCLEIITTSWNAQDQTINIIPMCVPYSFCFSSITLRGPLKLLKSLKLAKHNKQMQTNDNMQGDGII